jgi:hypothetical protein
MGLTLWCSGRVDSSGSTCGTRRFNLVFQSLWFLSWCPRMLRNTAIFGVKHQSINQSIKLKKKLLNQGILVVKLKSSLRKFYGRHHDFGNRYGVSVSQMRGHHDRNHKLWNIGSTAICRCGATGILLHINGKFIMEKSSLLW